MRIFQLTTKKTNEEIERDFSSLLQEGYAAGFLSHSQGVIYLTSIFLERYGSALRAIEADEEVIALRDAILDELGKPSLLLERDFAHMELFIAEFTLILTSDEEHVEIGERTLEKLDSLGGFRTLSYNALLGLCAMHLYQQVYTSPPKDQQGCWVIGLILLFLAVIQRIQQ